MADRKKPAPKKAKTTKPAKPESKKAAPKKAQPTAAAEPMDQSEPR